MKRKSRKVQRPKRRFQDDGLEAISKIRKPPIPRGGPMKSKDGYNRKDKSWMKDIERGDD